MDCNNIITDTSVSKLSVKGQPFYVKISWKQNEHDLFHIKIFDGEHSWSGKFSNEFAKNFSENIGESEEEYTINVQKGLSGNNSTFTYDFKADPNVDLAAEFKWKKRFANSTAILVHGSVPVTRDDTPVSKDTLIDFLLNVNSDLRQETIEYHKKCEILSSELEKCKSEMDKFISAKSELEESLYGKFVNLLNAKKRRIQLLEENLKQFE